MPKDTRTALVASASALLDAGGTDAVTLREAGRLGGVSHTDACKHFADEEALLAAVAARELERLGEVVDDAARQSRTSQEALRTVLRSHTAWALDHPVRFRLVFGAWTRPHADLDRSAGRARSALTAVVGQCQRDGVIPGGEPERRTALLLAVVHGALDLHLAGHTARGGKGRTDPDDVVDDLLDLLRTAAG
ncbi:TetR/AcrR family transcriptional regulator [Nocardiopsis sp. NPDC050513]|uniref:TetR/AcrR family transcriptional regulator n=1 Tax=Nocardiopsis sp. NPDC050513 TaxID=3364338 RepID=UPI0037BD2D17